MRTLIIAGSLLLTSCAGIRPVQLRPPADVPAGLTWGYGVEKVRGRPEAARRSAYLKAVDDLLSHGPLVVSRTVRGTTLVVDARSVNRTMESTFRLRASNIIQPSFLRAGVEDGFSWALVGTSERDIERGWEEFLSWRAGKISEALTLFEEANGPGRLGMLQASMSILEEVGAQDDPDLAYYRVKTALDTELSRLAELEAMKKRVLDAVVAGRLTEANRSLDIALLTGLRPPAYESLKYQIEDQRARAISIVVAGDSLYYNGRYKEALRRYEEAERLNVDHPGLVGKLATAEASHRQARSQTTMRTLGIVGGTVSRVLGEYFRSKREEERYERRQDRADEDTQDSEESVETKVSDKSRTEAKKSRVGDEKSEEKEEPDASEKAEQVDNGEDPDEDDDGEENEDFVGTGGDESSASETRKKVVRPVLMRIPSEAKSKSKPKKPPL